MNTDKILSDSLVSTLRTVLFASRRLLVIPVIAKFIGEAEYGIWATAVSLVALFAAAGRLHMHGALIRYSSRESIGREVFSGTLFLTSVALVVGGAALSMTALALGLFDTTVLTSGESLTLVVVVGALVVASGLFSFLSTVPRAMDRVKRTETIVMFELVVELVVVLGALYLSRDVVVGLIAVLGVTLAFDVVLAVAFVPGRLAVPSTDELSRFLRYAVPLMPKELSDSVLSSADKLLILVFLSPAAVGVYAVVYSLCNVFRTAAGVLNSTLYPAVTTAWDDEELGELRLLYRRIFEGYAALAIPGYVGLVFVAPALLRLLATPEVAARGAVLVPVIGAGFLVRAVESPVSYVLSATEQTEVVGYVSLAAAVANAVLNLVLIPLFGLFGAATATLASNLLITLVVASFADRSIDFSLPLTFTAKSVAATAVMGAVLWIAPDLDGPTGIAAIVLLGCVVFGLSLVVFRGVTVDDVTRVVTLVRRLR